MIKERIYLDNAATTPLRDDVLSYMTPYFSLYYGNPSSIHAAGREALEAVEKARMSVADALNADAREIYFTGSTTESDNLAIFGVLQAVEGFVPHLIISPLEHHAVLDAAKHFAKKNIAELTILPVDTYGLVKPENVKKAIRENTVLVSVMYAANEIGTIEPIKEISAICRETTDNFPKDKRKRIYIHTDAAAGAEYLPLNVEELGVDLLTLGPHKFGGPKGVGILYVKRDTKIVPIIRGGSQEKGLRPSTHNVPGIVGSARALELAVLDSKKEKTRVWCLTKYLLEELPKRVENSFVSGHPTLRSPHIASFIVEGVEGEAMVLKLSEKGIMASSGSACTSGSLEPSHVLLAIGLPPEKAHGSVRFSLGRDTSKEDIDYVLEVMPKIVSELREMNPLYS